MRLYLQIADPPPSLLSSLRLGSLGLFLLTQPNMYYSITVDVN